jgi:hypothetical protein
MVTRIQRAQVFSVNTHGHVEIRLVAVHPVLGIIGTKTTSRFNIRMSALATRCLDYLAGAVELFPTQERAQRVPRILIPEGEANLSFECAGRRRQDDAEGRGPTAESSTAAAPGLEAGSLMLTEPPNAFCASGNGATDAPAK